MGRKYSLEEQVIINNVKESHPHVCFYCKRPLNKDEITIDHMNPLNRGGKTEGNNLVIACMHCNTEKGDMTIEEYMQFLKRKFDVINPVILEINHVREQLEKSNAELKLLDDEFNKIKLIVYYINALNEKRSKLRSLIDINIEKLKQLEAEKKIKLDMQSVLTRRLVGQLNDSKVRENFINNVYNNVSIIDTNVTINLA